MKENKKLFKLLTIPEEYISGNTKFVLKGITDKQNK